MSDSKVMFVDRRKQKAEEESSVTVLSIQETPQPVISSHTDRKWKSTGLLLVFLPGDHGQPIPAGRAVGLRDDGRPFIADFIFPPVWPENLDWVKEAKKRLGTFLGCDCEERNPCAYHKIAIPQWMQEDTKRINEIASKPLPEAIEVVVKADQARQQSKIILPR